MYIKHLKAIFQFPGIILSWINKILYVAPLNTPNLAQKEQRKKEQEEALSKIKDLEFQE